MAPSAEKPLSSSPPPSYHDGADDRGAASSDVPPDLSERLANLRLDTPSSNDLPTSAQCVAHLKFLESLYQMRQEIAQIPGAFSVAEPDPGLFADQTKLAEAKAKVSEKKWAIYVARAVMRFERWWNNAVPQTKYGEPQGRLTCRKVTTDAAATMVDQKPPKGVPLKLSKNNLPPLDVLMVWHAYMLNPRAFFEDCLRYGKIDFYETRFPWEAIDPCIDSRSFEYTASPEAAKNFQALTNLNWDNLEDPNDANLKCPNCNQWITVPWTRHAGYAGGSSAFLPGDGYADSDFAAGCPHCHKVLSHPYLRVQKFYQDLLLLLKDDTALPGTVLSVDGKPDKTIRYKAPAPDCLFASRVAKHEWLRKTLLDVAQPKNDGATMAGVKDAIEKALKDRSFIRLISLDHSRGYPKERVSIRRMMSRYWYNSSPFALDLAGAVIRQGTFIEKMHNIDWLHSPALQSTISRLLTKYTRFFGIMAAHPNKVAVPTLDVDLAWHTHQLSPPSYFAYSDKTTRKLIDHDDKIEESDLTDYFEWTSKTYQKAYGEPYSECTCWYCEAIRESHTSTFSRALKRRSATAADDLAQSDGTCDPNKTPHISAHNAVRSERDAARARVKAAELDKAYHKACQRARKKGKKEPVRDDYYYAYGWGYPVMYPMYVPYAVDPCIGGGAGMYAADPCYAATTTGGYGSCAAGSCGGMAAAGGAACGGTGGSCGGGGCGGGGGGGCGGGGGGGGCGGGGGGGGCGGGGGGA